MVFRLSSLGYHTYAGDEIAIITTAPQSVTEITQNHKGYDVMYQTSSCLENCKCASLYIWLSSAIYTFISL